MEQWLVAFGTLVLAIVAVFQDRLRSWVASPKLRISVATASPYCQKIIVINNATGYEADGYFLRICVENISSLMGAYQVEVFAAELLKKGIDGKYHPSERFDPMCLIWSHSFQPFANLSPGMKRYCFIGRVINPRERAKVPNFDSKNIPSGETCLSLATEIERNTKPHIILAGRYRLKCSIGGSNTKSISSVFDLEISGKWYEEENKMFERGFNIDLIDPS